MRIPGLWRTTQAVRAMPAYVGGAVRELRTRISPIRPGTTLHDLGVPLIVSLTSYRPRFGTLLPTLRRLLSQDMLADGVWLWIAEVDAEFLPNGVRSLEGHGLHIATTADLKSYKKFVPALMQHPGAFIAIADDDVAYDRSWLAELVAAYKIGRPAVIAHRARRMPHKGDVPYRLWQMETEGLRDDPWLVPTGIGGVLYPPGSLTTEALDAPRFTRLAEKGDDLWLFWMARRAGFGCRMVERIHEPKNWNGSQAVALHHANAWEGGRNDQYVADLLAEFGPPVAKGPF